MMEIYEAMELQARNQELGILHSPTTQERKAPQVEKSLVFFCLVTLKNFNFK